MDPRHINNLWINSLLQVFADLGLDIAELSWGMKGIEDGRLAAGCQLDLVEARTLWHRAAALSHRAFLGIEVGRRLNPRASGFLFPLLLHSPSVRTALELRIRYQTLISENGSLRPVDTGDSSREVYEYVPAQSSVASHSQQVLSVITATLRTLSRVSSGRCQPRLVRLPSAMDAQAIADLLGCPVESTGDRYWLELDGDSLDLEISGRDEHLYQLLLQYADGLSRTQRAGQSFLEYIKSHIDGEPLVQTDIQAVALAVGMKTRTLQRHLDEQGTSFRKLKEGLLKEKVLELLVVRQRPARDIAETLGYADVSTFHRAFRAWFGVTPRQFKSQIGS